VVPYDQGSQDYQSQDPAQVTDQDDPGDEVQRNFRYQHCYGVMLLVAGATYTEPYTAVWCEHHEDILAERGDGSYDAFQVKTRRAETGAWEVTHDGFKRSIRRFVRLIERFDDRIHRLAFVSNTECADHGPSVRDRRRLQRSPHRLLEAAQSAGSAKEMAEPFPEVLETMATFCECSQDELLAVLKKVDLIKGPTRQSFDAELAHTALSRLEAGRNMVPAQLSAVRDELIQRVWTA
jgi:hypothetical protein